MNKITLSWLGVCLAATFQPPVHADTVEPTEATHRATDDTASQLSPITVTAGTTMADELSSAKSVSIYTQKDIQNSGVTSVMDFLKYYTEIQTDPSFGNVLNPKISMRGFGNGDGYQNINVIVDGFSLNQIDSVSQQLAAVPVDAVAKIEVVKSDGAVVYGDNTAAGTIIIRTNNGFDRNALYGNLKTSFGTYDTSLTHLNLGSVQAFDGFKVLADGHFTYLNSDGKKPVLADGSKDSTENINGKAMLGLQAAGLEILGSFIKDDATVNYTGYMTPEDFKRDPDAAVTTGRTNIIHKEDWTASAKYKINDQFNLAYTYANKARVSKFPDPQFPFFADYASDDHRFTLQTLQDHFAILAGVDYNDNTRSTGTEITGKENVGIFISGDYFATDRLTVNAGFRQAFIRFTHDDADTHLAKTIQPNSYNLGLNYALSAKDAVFTNYVHAFQSPDIDRFFYRNFFVFPIKTTFNFAINPAEINTYSVGYKHLEDDLKIKAEFYYTDLNNEIYFDSNRFINTNFDSSEKYGVELFLYKDFGWLHGSVNYLYTATRAKLGTSAFEISGQPQHIVLATVGKDFTSTLLPLHHHSVNLTHKYQSESFAQDDFDNSLGRQRNYNATTFNYQLSDHKHWTLDFSILNLFDVDNGQFVDWGTTSAVAYPTNYQRTFQGSVSYQF